MEAAVELFIKPSREIVFQEIELSKLFDNVLKNNELEKEIENLIIYKKALFQSNFVSESELLSTLKPLINTETSWKPHVLFLNPGVHVDSFQLPWLDQFHPQPRLDRLLQ